MDFICDALKYWWKLVDSRHIWYDRKTMDPLDFSFNRKQSRSETTTTTEKKPKQTFETDGVEN